MLVFDHLIEAFSETFQVATQASKQAAQDYLEAVDARGGTEAGQALQKALEQLADTPGNNSVLLITDGAVGNDAQLIALAEHSGVQVSAVGIGPSCRGGVLERLTQVSGGSCTLVPDNQELEPLLADLHRRWGCPHWGDIKLFIPLEDQTPRVWDAWQGLPGTFFARYRALPKEAAIETKLRSGSRHTQLIPVTTTDDPTLHRTWARSRLLDLDDLYQVGKAEPAELVALSLESQVLCRFTAFGVVDPTPTQEGEPVKVIQPVEPTLPGPAEVMCESPAPAARTVSPDWRRPTVSHDLLSFEVGRGLLSLVDRKVGARLIERALSIRRHIAMELGFVIPDIRWRDSLQLKPNSYAIKVKEVTVASGELFADKFLALGKDPTPEELPGPRVNEPTYNQPGVWISKEQRSVAEGLGCMIFDPVSVAASHLTEVIREYAVDLFGLQALSELLDATAKTHPVVVREALEQLRPVEVLQVLHLLLQERVSIRDQVTILEVLALRAAGSKEPEELAGYVRVALRRALCAEYSGIQNQINSFTLSPRWEQNLEKTLEHDGEGWRFRLEPEAKSDYLRVLSSELATHRKKGWNPILITSPDTRFAWRKLLVELKTRIPVISTEEIPPEVELHRLAELTF